MYLMGLGTPAHWCRCQLRFGDQAPVHQSGRLVVKADQAHVKITDLKNTPAALTPLADPAGVESGESARQFCQRGL